MTGFGQTKEREKIVGAAKKRRIHLSHYTHLKLSIRLSLYTVRFEKKKNGRDHLSSTF